MNSTNILQISDLHFTSELYSRGGRWRSSGAVLTKAHDFEKLSALTTSLAMLENSLPIGARIFDHLFVSGDVSTDGSRNALMTARSYLESGEFCDPVSRRLTAHGLQCSENVRTVVPGNHDRYGRLLPIQGRRRAFESVFGHRDYPYIKLIEPSSGDGPKIILFVFDSTQTIRLGERFSPHSAAKRIARGEVSAAECRWMADKARQIGQSRTVEGVPIDINSCVRVALLHHHPVVISGDAPNPFDITRASERARRDDLVGMDKNQEFVQACLASGINLVLFGHQHYPYHVEKKPNNLMQTPFGLPAPVHFICCPSLSEYSAKTPGFFIHAVFRSHAEVHYYSWTGGAFSETPVAVSLDFNP